MVPGLADVVSDALSAAFDALPLLADSRRPPPLHARREGGPTGGLQLVGEDVSTCRLRVFLYFILLCETARWVRL